MKPVFKVNKGSINLLDYLNKAKGKKIVKVGFPAGKIGNEPTGERTVDVAVWNEFGTDTIPSRPFMRRTLSSKRSAIKALQMKSLQAVAEGKSTLERELEFLGITLANWMRYTIDRTEFVANKASTLRKKNKRGKRPLVDSGTMRQSITYVVANND